MTPCRWPYLLRKENRAVRRRLIPSSRRKDHSERSVLRKVIGSFIAKPSISKPAGHRARYSAIALLAVIAFVGCRELPPPPKLTDSDIGTAPEYVIAPLDTVQIFVWRAPGLSVTVPVRPDGRITVPLVEDLVAAGKSPTVLARDIEEALRPFVQEPKARVVVEGFANQTMQMVKVIGEVARPVTMHYQMHMSVLDVMAEAQGLTGFANGNNAKLIRKANGRELTYQLKLKDLLEDGQMSANAKLRPGDLIVVPKSLL
jgi:polysaccharide export outer membrane protein